MNKIQFVLDHVFNALVRKISCPLLMKKTFKFITVVFLLATLTAFSVIADEHIEDTIIITTPTYLELRARASNGFYDNTYPYVTNLEIALFFIPKGKKLRPFVGANIFLGGEYIDDNPEGEGYAGLEATAGLIIGDRYAAYVAANVFAGASTWCGKTKRRDCSEKEEKEDTLDYTLGVAPEVGIRVNLYKNFYISVYQRRSYSVGGLRDYTSTGIGLGFRSL